MRISDWSSDVCSSDLLPRDHALRLALAKAQAVARGPDEIVLAGDTCVGAGRRILPKADTPEMVRQCLELLSGRRHAVWSAVAVLAGSGRLRRVRKSVVWGKSVSVGVALGGGGLIKKK